MDSPAEGASAPTPRRTRGRRLSGFAVLFALVALMGLWAVGQPWWSFELATVEPVTADLQRLQPVSASAEVSARELVAVQPPPATPAFGAQHALPERAPSSMFGLPSAAALLLIAAAFVVVGAFAKLTLVTVLGLAVMPFAWSAHATLIGIVENPMAGGAYVTRMTAVDLFQMLLMVGFGLAGVTCVQVFMVNAAARAKTRAAARADGQPASPVLVMLHTMLTSQLARFTPAEQNQPPKT